MKQVKINVAPEIAERWRVIYYATISQHRLSYNQWLIARIEQATKRTKAK